MPTRQDLIDFVVKEAQLLDAKRFEEFKTKLHDNLALDHHGELVYIAPSRVNLQLTQERWPEVRFAATREHGRH